MEHPSLGKSIKCRFVYSFIFFPKSYYRGLMGKAKPGWMMPQNGPNGQMAGDANFSAA